MAHIHGNKSGAAEIKSAAGAGAAKMMDSAMEKMGMAAMEKASPAMMEGMGPMMNMGEGMMHGMGQTMNPGMTKGVAYGVAVSAGAGKSVFRRIFTHPATLIGIGFVVGYLAHKYRKSLVTSSEAEEASSDEA